MNRLDMIEIDICPKCNLPFEVSEEGGRMPGSKEPEEIRCPYDGCDGEFLRSSNGYFRTHKLSKDEIAEYNARPR